MGGGSCTSSIVEEEPLKLLSKEIEIFEGTVRVESFDRYENLITGREKIGVLPFLSFQENFQEMMKSGKNLRISQEGYNEINSWDGSTLLEILDQDGFVILEKYLIYLNFNNRTAVVSTNLELKEKILEGDVSSDDIKLFSFDDDVIGLLETNSPSTIPKSGYNLRIASVFDPLAATATIGCGWDKCDNSQYFNDPLNGDIIGLGNNGGTFRYRLDAKHVYQAAAISFQLFSKVNHMRKPEDGSLLWTATSTSLYIFWDYEYLSKKNGSTLQKAIFQGNTVNNELVATYYSSGRGLEKFYLRSQFYAIPGGNHGYSPAGAYWQFNLQQIDKGY